MTSNIPFSKTKYFVQANGSDKTEVIDIYESYTGWYWFITDKPDHESEFQDDWFGLVVGLETEWGYVWYPELDQLIQQGIVWKVPKANWFSISHVITEHEQ